MAESLLSALLLQAAGGAILAVIVAAVGRRIGHPEVIHVLWLAVLLKLLVPPVIELAVVPSPASAAATTTAVFAPRASELPQPRPAAPAVTASGSPAPWLLGLWAAGALVTLALALVRIRRFRRLVDRAPPAPAALAERLAGLAARLGLHRTLRLRLLDARISPLVWTPLFAPSEILFPGGLFDRLEDDELDAVLVHELAHVRRRDPWVRVVELLAGTVFWWHPAVYWARRGLRRSEERACDAWVARTLERGAHAYVEGILKTLELLAGGGERLPQIATGIEARDLEARLTMILENRTPRLLAPRLRWTLAGLALGLLLVVPTWADRDTGSKESDEATETATGAAAAKSDQDLVALRQQVLEKEDELRRLRMALEEKEHELQLRRAEAQIADQRSQAAKLRADGQAERAVELERQAEAMEQRLELERQLLDLRHQHFEVTSQLDKERRELELQLEAKSRELQEQAEASEGLVRALELQLQGHERDLEGSHDAALLRLRAELEALRARGESTPADEEAARAEIERLQQQLDQASRQEQ